MVAGYVTHSRSIHLHILYIRSRNSLDEGDSSRGILYLVTKETASMETRGRFLYLLRLAFTNMNANKWKFFSLLIIVGQFPEEF